MTKYKKEFALSERKSESATILEKHPDRIPVILEQAENSNLPSVDRKKYLVPKSFTVGQFVFIVRKRIELSPDKAIFIFANRSLPATSAMMSTLYNEHKHDDGFLYLQYSAESTFGMV